MTTAVIVQARMGSSRLPGKVMMDLAGRPVLHHVLTRCALIPGADIVVCALSEDSDSDVLEMVARESGAVVFRGSETDVLARYAGAARSVDADSIMRVTSDCPLIDAQVCGAVLDFRNRMDVDYAANNMPSTFPHGLDCEAMSADVLFEADREAKEPHDREHVTPWIRKAQHLRRANLSSEDASLARHRWTLDYSEDMAFFRAVFEAFPAGSAGSMNDVLDVLRHNPSIYELNAMRGAHKAPPNLGVTS